MAVATEELNLQGPWAEYFGLHAARPQALPAAQ